jgi:adenylate kinase family enzyme
MSNRKRPPRKAPSVDSSEHPLVASVRLRALRRVLWLRETWGPVPSGPAAVIHNEEVDRILADPSSHREAEADFYGRDPEASAIAAPLAEAESQLAADRRWRQISNRFGLGQGDKDLLATALALVLDPHLAKVYAYVHDQPEISYATPWLAAALYGSDGAAARLEADAPLLHWQLLRRLSDSVDATGALTGYAADPALAAWLVEGGDADLPAECRLARTTDTPATVLFPDLHDSMRGFIAAMEAAKADAIEIELCGATGSGRRTLAAQLAKDCRRPLLIVDAARLPRDSAGPATARLVAAAQRSARLRGAWLYWSCAPDTAEPPAPAPVADDGLLIVGRTRPAAGPATQGASFRGYTVPPLNLRARLDLWRTLSDQPAPTQIREWLLSPGEITRIRQVAHAGDEAIAQACRRPSESAGLLTRLPLPFDRKGLVLPPGTAAQLDALEQQIRLRWEVYEDWGFDRLCPNGRGIVALFAGPSGTGKTMAAQVLAKSLGVELYRLDPANVVNKYIGETEKRLKIVFDEADHANSLLLIDECEGLFGQRFSSKDAHDRYANLEIDYLLQRLERYEGVAILATNRKNDVDPAFQRRIRVIIDFLPPDPPERRRLWRLAFDADNPAGAARLDGIEWDALGERVNLTGAEIKLAALNAAFLARAAGERIGMPHVLTSVRREIAKRGQTLRGFE